MFKCKNGENQNNKLKIRMKPTLSKNMVSYLLIIYINNIYAKKNTGQTDLKNMFSDFFQINYFFWIAVFSIIL